ncbi:uncharacterized protein MONBRDRAFT_39139 [Monosiga brevicollis MX1]|uniref:Uncharacterized protein n=1 Tax=Monosiga brevicollis TaxID=81824 RepID=A9VCH7_MONBE|nr:uncharacterized protein MONBRDRAFT_39139 [Monosiga brevicollis MX1]EDQ84785.1 predicted protein [Monosiga brevicollis MX1]|eukprot:XP_001750435.1 hypothetical protein [Monosiga brevicollis MX1]
MAASGHRSVASVEAVDRFCRRNMPDAMRRRQLPPELGVVRLDHAPKLFPRWLLLDDQALRVVQQQPKSLDLLCTLDSVADVEIVAGEPLPDFVRSQFDVAACLQVRLHLCPSTTPTQPPAPMTHAVDSSRSYQALLYSSNPEPGARRPAPSVSVSSASSSPDLRRHISTRSLNSSPLTILNGHVHRSASGGATSPHLQRVRPAPIVTSAARAVAASRSTMSAGANFTVPTSSASQPSSPRWSRRSDQTSNSPTHAFFAEQQKDLTQFSRRLSADLNNAPHSSTARLFRSRKSMSPSASTGSLRALDRDSATNPSAFHHRTDAARPGRGSASGSHMAHAFLAPGDERALQPVDYVDLFLPHHSAPRFVALLRKMCFWRWIQQSAPATSSSPTVPSQVGATLAEGDPATDFARLWQPLMSGSKSFEQRVACYSALVEACQSRENLRIIFWTHNDCAARLLAQLDRLLHMPHLSREDAATMEGADKVADALEEAAAILHLVVICVRGSQSLLGKARALVSAPVADCLDVVLHTLLQPVPYVVMLPRHQEVQDQATDLLQGVIELLASLADLELDTLEPANGNLVNFGREYLRRLLRRHRAQLWPMINLARKSLLKCCKRSEGLHPTSRRFLRAHLRLGFLQIALPEVGPERSPDDRANLQELRHRLQALELPDDMRASGVLVNRCHEVIQLL